MHEFDLGRTEQANDGLVRFKDHLGATRTSLRYWRSSPTSNSTKSALESQLAQRFLAYLPDSLFRLSGEIFYRHVG
jgi:hypothetical protein